MQAHPVNELEELRQRVSHLEKENYRLKQEKSIENLSENVFKALFEQSPYIIAYLNEEGRYLSANHNMLKSLGFSMKEVIGHKVTDLIPGEAAEYRLNIIKKTLNEWKIHSFEDCRSGNCFYHTYIPIKLAGNRICLIIAQDITEIRDGEEELVIYNNYLINKQIVELTILNEEFQQEIKQRRRMEKNLERLNRTLVNFQSNINDNIKLITKSCQDILAATHVVYCKLDEEVSNLTTQHKGLNSFADYFINSISLKIIEQGFMEVPYIITYLDDSVNSKTELSVIQSGLKTFIGYSVYRNKKLIGALCLFYKHEKKFNENELRVMEILSRILGFQEERKSLEEILLQRQELESSILNAIPHAVVGLHNRTIIFTNSSVETVFGWKADELIGQKTRIFYRTDEDYLKIGKQVYKILEKHSVYTCDFPCKKQDSTYILCRLNVSRIGESLDEKRIVIVYEDITEQKLTEEGFRKAKEKYYSLFNSVPVGLYRSRVDNGTILVCNDVFSNLFGYNNSEECLEEFTPSKHYVNIDFYQKMLTAIYQRGAVQDFEVKMRKKDDSIVWMSYSAVAYSEENYIEGVATDITDRKNLELEMLKREKLESLGVIAGGIAHNFNNILTAISSQITVAKLKSSSTKEFLTSLNKADKMIFQAKYLSQQLITFAKGGIIHKKATSIAKLIQDAIDFSLAGSNIKCSYSIRENLPVVMIDPNQISQVINNIILNARDAMPEGGEIEIKIEMISKPKEFFLVSENDYIKITIKDQGQGIAEEYVQKIFDPYFTTKPEGTGLGLATSYSIIKKHKGLIRVESKINVGTVFYIYLPVFDKKEGTEIEQRIDRQVKRKNKGKILLLDDNMHILNNTGEILEHYGYELELCRDGKEAILLYQKEMRLERKFDIVILDLIIPAGMGGVETLKALLGIDPKVKAIAMSGYSNDSVITDFQKYNFKAVVIKPYSIRELKHIINEVMAK